MSLDAIEVFVEVVNAKSFSRAAASLGMPTTTVSAKVARLEKRLGVSLIRRTTRQLHVTEAGQRYYDHCAVALMKVSEAESELLQNADEVSGTLRLTAPADLANSVLQPVITRYLDKYPKASLKLTIANSHVDLVHEGIDLAIRVGRIRNYSLLVKKYFELAGTLWASPKYLEEFGVPVTVEDLKAHRLIEITVANGGFPLISETGERSEVKFQSRLICDDMQTSKVFAENSAGIAVLPDVVGRHNQGQSEKLVRVLPGHKSLSVAANFVYPNQRFTPKTVRAFIDTALEVRNESADTLHGA